MSAVILEFKRPASGKYVAMLCCQCGGEATHRVELVNLDMSSPPTFAGYKYFCDGCDKEVQAGD